MTIIITLLIAGAVPFLCGIIWILRQRGQTTRRSGAEIGAEIMAENLERRSRMRGDSASYQKTFFWGKGWAIKREASISYKELKKLMGEGDLNIIVPVGLVFIGMIGIITGLGLSMFHLFDSVVPGLIFFGFFIYGIYVVIRGFLKA